MARIIKEDEGFLDILPFDYSPWPTLNAARARFSREGVVVFGTRGGNIIIFGRSAKDSEVVVETASFLRQDTPPEERNSIAEKTRSISSHMLDARSVETIPLEPFDPSITWQQVIDKYSLPGARRYLSQSSI